MTSPWNHVAAGTKDASYLPVLKRADGTSLQLPLLIVRGACPGKTLLATACVHGDEFEGPAALWRLFEELKPSELRGTFVAVPLVNPPAYEAGLRVNPDDRQDLARVFPGNPAGTATEQIAHCLSEQLFPCVDFYLDLHSAGQYYMMPPLVGYQLRQEPLLGAQRAAAKAVGLPLMWGTPGLPGRSLSAAAERGVPSLYVEITGEGRCLPEDVAIYTNVLRRLLAHLGIVASAPPADPPRWLVEDSGPQAGFLQVQNRAPLGGFFEAHVSVLAHVEAGQDVGVIRDPLGKVIHVVKSPHQG